MTENNQNIAINSINSENFVRSATSESVMFMKNLEDIRTYFISSQEKAEEVFLAIAVLEQSLRKSVESSTDNWKTNKFA